jgi:transposase
VRDAEWIADLVRHGLRRARCVPPPPQREVRELTRTHTTVVEERARIITRILKGLADATLNLAAVATDITGLSAGAMLDALLTGHTDPDALADLARGKRRGKRRSQRDHLAQALTARLRPQQQFLLSEHLAHRDDLDEAIARFGAAIAERLRPQAVETALLDTIPGVSQRSAEILRAALGTDRSRFPSARHLASWAGRCPGTNESAGQRRSGTTRQGSRWLPQVLIAAAQAAARTTTTSLSAQYHRLAARRGPTRALVALGHTILVRVYHVLQRGVPSHELGGTDFDERQRQAVEHRLVHRLAQLGYRVTLPHAVACDPFSGQFS